MNDDLVALFDRAFDKVEKEIVQYPTDEMLWTQAPGTTNTAGTLLRHLMGNLKYFIGANLGGSGYVRDRPDEFSRRGVPRHQMLAEFNETRHIVITVVQKLTSDDFEAEYPNPVFPDGSTARKFVIHLLTHIWYHLGQINYHRRILESAAQG